MKRFFLLLFCIAYLGFSLDAMQTIKVAHPKDYFPYSGVDETGESVGILIDWWKLWGLKTGVDVVFIADTRENCVQKVIAGDADVLAGFYYNEKRSQQLDFGDYIMRTKTVLFLKEGNAPKNISNFSSPIYVIDNPLLIAEIESQIASIQVNGKETFESLTDKVKAKSIEAFIYDLPNPISKFKSVNAPKGYYEYRIMKSDKLRPAVKKGNREMLDLIIKGSSKINDAELVELAEDWPVFKKDRTRLQMVLLFLTLTILMALIFTYVLQHQKKKRKVVTKMVDGTDWQIIIEKGENDFIEFKSSMRWDYREEKPNKALEQVIVKTISAFLNTKGGMLFIGVDDDGNTLGLENDYNTLKKKNQDGFLLALTGLINQNLGKTVHKFVTSNIISINDKDVCIVSVERSNTPVFMGKNGKEEFYIRASASSQPMSMREAFDYIKTHWGEN